MNWVVFSYSLPARSRSGARVMVWRRLSRLGAISPTSGAYVLPARDECVEALQWLAQETRQAGGDALIMRVEQFEGLSDSQLVGLFNQARQAEFGALDAQAAALEKVMSVPRKPRRASEIREALKKLRRRQLEIARADYFDCADAGRVAARLDRIERAILPGARTAAPAPAEPLAAYRDKRWVTRPRPHVDRLACIWLIRRFINPQAIVRYAAQPTPAEIAFDMSGARFGHEGTRCSFETMLAAFSLDDPALRTMAEIVHAIDLRDDKFSHPQIEGLDAILSGWRLANLSDAGLEAHGLAVFEGLYATLLKRPPAKVRPKKRKIK